MAASTKITLRMEKDVKEQFEDIMVDLGMNLTTGLNVLAKAVIRHGGFPFELSQAYRNNFNVKRIEHSRQQAASEKLIYKSSEELGLDDE